MKEGQLAKVYESYEVVGTVLPDIAEQLGLSDRVKVAAGAGITRLPQWAPAQ